MKTKMISARVSLGSLAILKKAKETGIKKETLIDKAIKKHGLEIIRKMKP